MYIPINKKPAQLELENVKKHALKQWKSILLSSYGDGIHFSWKFVIKSQKNFEVTGSVPLFYNFAQTN